MKTSPETAKLIVDAAYDSGYDVRSYSGRGMSGAKCLGIEFNRGCANIILDIVSEFVNNNPIDDGAAALMDLINALRNSREDSMGLGGIIYWPNIEWSDSFDNHNQDMESTDDE